MLTAGGWILFEFRNRYFYVFYYEFAASRRPAPPRPVPRDNAINNVVLVNV
jgi:hypothetical protein